MIYIPTTITLKEGTIVTQAKNGIVVVDYQDGTSERVLPCGVQLDRKNVRAFLSPKMPKED